MFLLFLRISLVFHGFHENSNDFLGGESALAGPRQHVLSIQHSELATANTFTEYTCSTNSLVLSCVEIVHFEQLRANALQTNIVLDNHRTSLEIVKISKI